MLLVIPATFIFLYKYISCKVTADYDKTQRAEILFRTVICMEAVVLVLTNVLSLFHILTRPVLFVSWLFVAAFFAFLYGKNKNNESENNNKDKTAHVTYIYRIMIGLLAVLSAVLLFGAVFTVPCNYDSMTYHLARIGYWIDHKTVAHYVTNIDRQIYSPVLAEYNLLFIILLAGNDTFVNLLQYFSMFAAAYFIYQSARKLGTDKLFSFFGAFAFMMMPLTISQSITTQNDLFATLIFVLFIYKLLDVISWEKIILNRSQILDIVMLGLTVAYAYLAKTSVCASMLLFMPWLFIVRLCKKDMVSKLCGSIGIAAVSILIPISETLIRTYLSAGSLMTDTASGNIMVATKNISYILVNILKNFSLLITQNYYRPLNGFVYRIAIGLGQKLHVEVNHEAISFHGFDFLHHMNMGEDMYSHDKTPSAFAAYLAVLAGVILLIMLIKAFLSAFMTANRKKTEQDTLAVSFGFCISAWLSFGFIMALLRWQPWGTRLMYPALAVTIIMSVHLLYHMTLKWKEPIKKVFLALLIVLATLLAIPSVTYNMQPSIEFVKGGCQNRINQYFRYNYRKESYEKLIALALDDNAADIGLIISGDGYDYPLWLMLRQTAPNAKLRHLITEKASEADAVAPDCIFMIERDVYAIGESFDFAGETYICIYNNEIGDCYLQRASTSSHVLAIKTLSQSAENAEK